MTTQRRQRLAFGIITTGLIGALTVAGLTIGPPPAPQLVGVAPASIAAPASPSLGDAVSPSVGAPMPPSIVVPAAVRPSTNATLAAPDSTVDRRSRALELIHAAEPPATLPARPQVAVAPQAAAGPRQAAEAQPAPVAADRLEVATTAHEALDVEITVSSLPDPPAVAASHQTETVRVSRRNDPWAPVRECESGGDYRINTGNGFYGAYQFTRSTWNWVAEIIGRDDLVGVSPQRAAPADQDLLANALAFEVAGGGLHHWPVCGRNYGR